MKKLFLILTSLIFCLTMSFADEASHSTGGHAGSPHAGANRSSHGGTRAQKGNTQAKQNWDGHNFKPEYFHSNFGREHGFNFRNANWQGERFHRGSRFFFGGAWFLLGVDIPEIWWDCDTYVDVYEDGYGLYCPLYPGQVFAVSVVF